MKLIRKFLVFIFLLLPAMSFSGEIVRYMVVYSGINITDLENKIKYAMIAGWQPLGGLALGRGNYGCVYYQAMVRYREN